VVSSDAHCRVFLSSKPLLHFIRSSHRRMPRSSACHPPQSMQQKSRPSTKAASSQPYLLSMPLLPSPLLQSALRRLISLLPPHESALGGTNSSHESINQHPNVPKLWECGGVEMPTLVPTLGICTRVHQALLFWVVDPFRRVTRCTRGSHTNARDSTHPEAEARCGRDGQGLASLPTHNVWDLAPYYRGEPFSY
jgi:hypothetical protein